MKVTPRCISIRDMKEKEQYQIKKFEAVETTNGRRIRLTLDHKQFNNKEVYVHLPERVLEIVQRKSESFNQKCRSNKPKFVVHMGVRGQPFILKFNRHPKKHI